MNVHASDASLDGRSRPVGSASVDDELGWSKGDFCPDLRNYVWLKSKLGVTFGLRTMAGASRIRVPN